MTLQIRELQTSDEIVAAFPVMKQLRTHLNERTYLDLVITAMEQDQYKMFALLSGEEIVAVAGFKPMITLYYGRFVWVCDLVTDEQKRSEGYGEKLLTFIHNWAKEHQYESIALSSGLQRTDAHRFYETKMDLCLKNSFNEVVGRGKRHGNTNHTRTFFLYFFVISMLGR